MSEQDGKCYFCGAEAVSGESVDRKPACGVCRDRMRDGILLLSVRDDDCRSEPCRTGGMWVLSEAVARRTFCGVDFGTRRWLFVEDGTAAALGFSREKAG